SPALQTIPANAAMAPSRRSRARGRVARVIGEPPRIGSLGLGGLRSAGGAVGRGRHMSWMAAVRAGVTRRSRAKAARARDAKKLHGVETEGQGLCARKHEKRLRSGFGPELPVQGSSAPASRAGSVRLSLPGIAWLGYLPTALKVPRPDTPRMTEIRHPLPFV